MNPTRTLEQVIAHESVRRRARKRGSARAFGLVFAGVFALFGLLPLLRHREPRVWLLGAGLGLAIIALLYPRLLDRPNQLWSAFGERLSLVASTVLVAVIYFAVVTPMGAIGRLRGKDPLGSKFAPRSPTYWIARDRPAPTAESLTRQF